MTSVLRFIKQRPSDSQYFISLVASPQLSVFYSDPATATNSYVSGAAAGFFSTSTVGVGALSTNNNQIFRDMGVTIVSSLRTFRRIQLLTQDQGQGSAFNGAPGGPGGSSGSGVGIEWSDQGNLVQNAGTPGSGVFTQGTSTEGVTGTQSNNPYSDGSFGVFYFETGANGIGLAAPLVRFG